MLSGEPSELDTAFVRDTAHPPIVQALRFQSETVSNDLATDPVNEFIMCMTAGQHSLEIHDMCISCKPSSLIDDQRRMNPSVCMEILAQRLHARIEELDTTQALVAARSGLSTQRFGNYIQGTRTPDVATLARIAKALNTSTDYLLGLTDDADELLNSLEPILLRLFELEGVPQDRAQSVVLIAREALRLLTALQDDGDVRSRSRLAAQAAWQIRSSLKPH